METETIACCACLHVEYRPVIEDNGRVRQRWVCIMCEVEFDRKKETKE